MAIQLRTAREPASWRLALRPERWSEALLVLAPLVFAGRLADARSTLLALLTALAFALLSAAADAVGFVASRRSLVNSALALGCAATGLLVAGWVQRHAPPLGAYGPHALGPLGWGVLLLALGVADVLLLRLWIPADAVAIAISYVLRAVGGAAALRVPPSRWLVICSFLLGLFVALGRHSWRPNVEARRPGARRLAVQRATDLIAVAAVGSYVLYALSPETEASVGSHALLWTAPLVALLVARHREHIRLGFGRDPLTLALRDKLALGAFLLWIAAVLFVIYPPP